MYWQENIQVLVCWKDEKWYKQFCLYCTCQSSADCMAQHPAHTHAAHIIDAGHDNGGQLGPDMETFEILWVYTFFIILQSWNFKMKVQLIWEFDILSTLDWILQNKYFNLKWTNCFHLPISPLCQEGHGESVAEHSEDLDTFLSKPGLLPHLVPQGLGPDRLCLDCVASLCAGEVASLLLSNFRIWSWKKNLY